jgi:hypothetical protein
MSLTNVPGSPVRLNPAVGVVSHQSRHGSTLLTTGRLRRTMRRETETVSARIKPAVLLSLGFA